MASPARSAGSRRPRSATSSVGWPTRSSAMRDREADLLRQVEDLQEQLAQSRAGHRAAAARARSARRPRRVLRSAPGRGRGDPQAGRGACAARSSREAQEESGRLREEAAAACRGPQRRPRSRRPPSSKRRPTARATQLREEAEQEADALRELAARETGEVREQAAAIAATEIDDREDAAAARSSRKRAPCASACSRTSVGAGRCSRPRSTSCAAVATGCSTRTGS